MNERIKELIEQATTFEEIWGRGFDTTQYTEHFSKEKFAELIVKECMAMCVNVSADYLKHRKAADDFRDKNIYAEGAAVCDILRYKMKKHFGVEE